MSQPLIHLVNNDRSFLTIPWAKNDNKPINVVVFTSNSTPIIVTSTFDNNNTNVTPVASSCKFLLGNPLKIDNLKKF